jgi:tRNA (guanosine-2'-O-)-methyltransferase
VTTTRPPAGAQPSAPPTAQRSTQRSTPPPTQPPAPRQLGATDVKRLNRSWRRRTEARVGLLLESVGQPFNLGSIIRTAAAFGVDQLWLCGDATTPEHPSARKTALGTDRYLPWEQVSDVRAGISAARADGRRVIAIELAAGAIPLHEAPLEGDICLALGNEDRGCSATLLAAADVVAYIPQAGKVGSLNVAAAAAVALAEARRREWAAADPLA